MPTIFSHAAFGVAIGSAFLPSRLRARFLVLTALCTILPDFDVVGFVFRVSYGSLLGHRGITHSILFAIVVGWFVATFCFRGLDVRRWKLVLYFALVTVSHPFLDMLTDGGLGVALLAPFSNERFFLPWRPIRVSPIGAGFFSERGLAVIASEFVWIWLPALITAATLWLLVRRRSLSGDAIQNDSSLSISSGDDL